MVKVGEPSLLGDQLLYLEIMTNPAPCIENVDLELEVVTV